MTARRRIFAGLAVACAVALLASSAQAANCARVTHDNNAYTVCEAELPEDRVALFLNGGDGKPYGGFSALNRSLNSEGQELAFAMNAGMYDDRLAPIGLYVEDGKRLKSANTNDGPGNFHLKAERRVLH